MPPIQPAPPRPLPDANAPGDPVPVSRALDHIVLPCRDLGAAASTFADLGFLVGRRNRHPWGTENHIVQFDGAFLELVAFAADAPAPRPTDDAFPFAGFLARLGSSQDPSGMVVLRSGDAPADAAAFVRTGIGAGRTLHFSRDAATPEGVLRTVSFTVAFADAPAMPDLGFFVCQHHRPENFWNPALQAHPNGSTGIAEVTLVADDPAAQASFLERFTGTAPEATDAGLVFDLGGSRLAVINAATGRALWRVDAPPRSPRLAALRFAAPGKERRVDLDGFPRLLIG